MKGKKIKQHPTQQKPKPHSSQSLQANLEPDLKPIEVNGKTPWSEDEKENKPHVTDVSHVASLSVGKHWDTTAEKREWEVSWTRKKYNKKVINVGPKLWWETKRRVY